MRGRWIEAWQHHHDYLPASLEHGERSTRRVIALTALMMVVEIVAGSVFNSMALLADGWHMASHASALGITAFAYAYARRHAGDSRYSFGTWKVGVLGGFSSAVVLAVIAVLIAWESLGRFTQPLTISFDEAILVDNLRAAYLHVLADALTSLFAIFALLTGKYFGWVWMDPFMGIVGSLIIGRWSYGLLRDTSRVLLDGDVEPEAVERLRAGIEQNGADRVADLHLWRVGPHEIAAIISIVSRDPQPPDHYRARAAEALGLAHVTVEVNPYLDG
jgi:Co/Zn/Cd efflux system component